jgi:cell division septum initiation protein DivIVA
MPLDILELVEKAEREISSASSVPGLGVRINPKEVQEILQKIRLSVPEQLREADKVKRERDDIISQAEREAKRIISAAEEEYRNKVAQTSVMKSADARAQDIVAKAEKDAEALLANATKEASSRKADADQYTLDVLRNLEVQINSILASVHKGINMLEGRE